MIIEREVELGRIKSASKWQLVFGRRKTGKSFLVENFVEYSDYFFVKQDRTILSKKDNKTLSYDTFIAVLQRGLSEEKTIVVDEFQRLGQDFFDVIHASKKQGKLILISSTLFLSKKLLGSNSPLLGFFAEVPIGLISLEDSLKAVQALGLDKKSTVELAVLAREPLAIDYFNAKTAAEARGLFAEVLTNSLKSIPSLVGEIFFEEQRSLSAVYEGILRSVASGKVVSSEISSYLFSRKLIGKDNPSIVSQYLNNLVEFGILKKIRVFEKNRFVYKHTSPLARVFYYADEKYNLSEKTPTNAEVLEIVNELMPKIIEDNAREFIARKLGLEESILEAKDYDVDALLLKFKKPQAAIEVKWTSKVTAEDVRRAEASLSNIDVEQKILVVPDKKNVKAKTSLEVKDLYDFL